MARRFGQGSKGATRRPSRRLSKKAARAYQGALEAVLCVPAGLVLGYGFDRWLDTSPWGVLVGIGVGMAGFVVAVMRLPRILERYDDQDPEASQEDQSRPPR